MRSKSKKISAAESWKETCADEAFTTTKALGFWEGGLILATPSKTSTPTLLIETRGESNPRFPQLDGLSVEKQKLRVDDRDGDYIKFNLMDPFYGPEFSVFTDGMLQALADSQEYDGDASSLLSVVLKWVNFFREKPAPYSRQSILGLIGELLTIRDAVDLKHFSYLNWEGPIGGIQDFIGQSTSVEVKVLSSRTGPVTHQISSLEQLETHPDVSLHLMSIRLHVHQFGSENLHELVGQVRKLSVFEDPNAKRYFDQALKISGYTLDIPVELFRFDILHFRLYPVDSSFPKLDPSMVDKREGVMNIKYEIDLSNMENFREDFLESKIRIN
jgi:hypothetical protein